MAYKIDHRRVAGVVTEVNEVLKQHGFNHGEVILGLSEYIGRVIVDASTNPVATQELTDLSHSHIKETVKIGSQATDRRIILPNGY